MNRTRIAGAYLAVICALGCHEGSGSDIGPKLLPISQYDYRVTVHDDAGRIVTGATVLFSGGNPAVVTGRSGRAFMQTRLVGSRTITIDGSNGASTNSSLLGSLTVAADLPGDDELDFLVYLPDGSASDVQSQATGVGLGADVTVDDSAGSGAILTIGAGDVIITQSGAPSVSLRTGKLSIGHLPPTLAITTGAPMVTTQGAFVFPLDMSIRTGGKLSVPNPISGNWLKTPRLFRLDSTTGNWVEVVTDVQVGSRIESSLGSVKRGGLYCFAVESLDLTTIRGRLLDERLLPIPGALVRGPQAMAKTAHDGRFSIDVPQKYGANSIRSVTLQCTGGRHYLPISVTLAPTRLTGAEVDTGDTEFRTRTATNVRTLMTFRGLIDVSRRLRLSSQQGLTSGGGNSGVNGEVHVEDLAAETVGFLTTRPIDEHQVQRAWGRQHLFSFVVDNTLSIFSTQENWRTSNHGGTLVSAVDKYGTGLIYQVHTMSGNDPTRGYMGTTDYNGFIAASVGLDNDVTLCMETVSNGRKVVSAFTLRGTASGRAEIPIERALCSLGVFQRFGMYEGKLTTPSLKVGNTRQVRASAGLILQDFYDDVFLGGSNALDAPVALEPAIPPPDAGPHFRVGILRGPGHLVAVEGNSSGGRIELTRFGIVTGLNVEEGTSTTQNIDLALTPNEGFQITGAHTNRDPAFTDADMAFDVAGELSSGLLVDIARSGVPDPLGGSPVIRLPSLALWSSDFTSYAVGYGASQATGVSPNKMAISQRVFARLDGRTIPNVVQLPIPTITLDSSTPINGFKVAISAPVEANYLVLNLRHETTTEVRDWTVVLPSDASEFTFHRFPSPMTQLLDQGSSDNKVWTLTVSCARIDSGELIRPENSHQEIFYRLQANWVGLKEADRRIAAFSSRSIQLTIND